MVVVLVGEVVVVVVEDCIEFGDVANIFVFINVAMIICQRPYDVCDAGGGAQMTNKLTRLQTK